MSINYVKHVEHWFLTIICGLLTWLVYSVNDLNHTMVSLMERIAFTQQKLEDHEARLRYLESKK